MGSTVVPSIRWYEAGSCWYEAASAELEAHETSATRIRRHVRMISPSSRIAAFPFVSGLVPPLVAHYLRFFCRFEAPNSNVASCRHLRRAEFPRWETRQGLDDRRVQAGAWTFRRSASTRSSTPPAQTRAQPPPCPDQCGQERRVVALVQESRRSTPRSSPKARARNPLMRRRKVVTRARFERATPSFGGWCSIQLSYRATSVGTTDECRGANLPPPSSRRSATGTGSRAGTTAARPSAPARRACSNENGGA